MKQALLPGLRQPEKVDLEPAVVTLSEAAGQSVAQAGHQASHQVDHQACHQAVPQPQLPGFSLIDLVDLGADNQVGSADSVDLFDDSAAGQSLHVFSPDVPHVDRHPISLLGVRPGQHTGQRPSSQAAKLLNEAEVILVERGQYPMYAKRKAEIIPLDIAGSNFDESSGYQDLASAFRSLEICHARGKKCVLICPEDPLNQSPGADLAAWWRQRHGETPPLRVLLAEPHNLSQAGLLAEGLALPWPGLPVVDIGVRGGWRRLIRALPEGAPLMIHTGASATIGALGRFLVDRGVDWYRLATLAEFPSKSQDKSQAVTQSSIRHYTPEQAAGLDFAPGQAVCLLPLGQARQPRLNLDSTDLVIIAPEKMSALARACAIYLLAPVQDAVVWVIGASCGLVALEIASLVQRGLVYAVEHDPEKILALKENRRLMGAANLEIVQGFAPFELEKLPDPHAILILGGLEKNSESETAWQRQEVINTQAILLLNVLLQRLSASGRLVAALYNPGTREWLSAYLDSHRLPHRLELLQASHMESGVDYYGMQADNPVFLIRVDNVAE